MQRIRFINPNGREVNIGLSPPYIFEKISGIGAEDVNMVTTEPAMLNGTAFHGLYVKDREITLSMHIYGRTRGEMYGNRQALISALSSNMSAGGQLGRLEYANDFLTVWIPAIVKRGPQATERAGNYNTSVQVVFYCPDPFWRAMTPEINKIAYIGGGLTFPLEIDSVAGVEFGAQGFEAVMNNTGDSPAPLRITITGPSTEPEVVKVSTGESIKIKRELYEGDVLVINTQPGARSATITRSVGTTEDAFGYIDLTSTFFLLDPGDNTLQYITGDASTTATILLESYSRFGGV